MEAKSIMMMTMMMSIMKMRDQRVVNLLLRHATGTRHSRVHNSSETTTETRVKVKVHLASQGEKMRETGGGFLRGKEATEIAASFLEPAGGFHYLTVVVVVVVIVVVGAAAKLRDCSSSICINYLPFTI